jgi:hypothetical protein
MQQRECVAAVSNKLETSRDNNNLQYSYSMGEMKDAFLRTLQHQICGIDLEKKGMLQDSRTITVRHNNDARLACDQDLHVNGRLFQTQSIVCLSRMTLACINPATPYCIVLFPSLLGLA